MELELTLTFAFEALSSLLLFALLFIYYRNYAAMKAKFTLGLLVFASLLLLQNILGMYYRFTMMNFYSIEAAAGVAIIRGIEVIALAVLLYISWE
ncbi:MAG: hypothetical protein QW568_04210 [Candidatus Anstonellaceae archaeon]